MARTSARNVNPSLSDDPRDKLLAALNWSTGKYRRSADYQRSPMYLDACLDWHQRLSADVVGSAHKGAAEGMAASLPPAPRCPL